MIGDDGAREGEENDGVAISLEIQCCKLDDEGDDVNPLEDVLDGAFGGGGDLRVLLDSDVFAPSSSWVKSMTMVSFGGVNLILEGDFTKILGFFDLWEEDMMNVE